MSYQVICPIRPKNIEDFVRLEAKINQRADLVEIWLDQIEDHDDFLARFAENKSPQTQYLGVCKRPEEKGTFGEGPEERIGILQRFLDAGGDLVDLDVTKNSEMGLKRVSPQKLILSFHDFESVPDDLEKIFETMQDFDPLIYKFAVTTNTKENLKKFLDFVKNFPKNQNAIFTTMGTYGTEGREKIGAKSWGQFFALDNASTTASGQKTLQDS